MKYTFTENYSKDFLGENMMGPNSMRIAEELAAHVPIKTGTRVLDLGCGKGLSTIFLEKRYGAQVFAADLWIPPTENYERFRQESVDAIPISVDAIQGLPFAHGYFDGLFSVDAYHYFGANETMLPSLLPFVHSGGWIAIAMPGLQAEFAGGVPIEMQPYWPGDTYFFTTAWWKELLAKTEGIDDLSVFSMDCHHAAWQDWLQGPNPHAREDADMMRAEGGKYFNTIGITARVI